MENDAYKLAIKETKLLKKGKNIELNLDDLSLKLYIDPIIDGEIVSYMIIVIDNSKNKKAEIMRREFTANVSHELKSPLTIINIKNVVDQSISRSKRISDKKNITVESNIDDIYIKTHESLFADLISNIYENTIKYNKVNGKISINYEKNDRGIKVFIEDRGIGIKKEDLPRIFERFYVADKQRTRTLKSTGLGLSIVKHICDYLNYGIKVDSEYGLGTKFTIFIPII